MRCTSTPPYAGGSPWWCWTQSLPRSLLPWKHNRYREVMFVCDISFGRVPTWFCLLEHFKPVFPRINLLKFYCNWVRRQFTLFFQLIYFPKRISNWNFKTLVLMYIIGTLKDTRYKWLLFYLIICFKVTDYANFKLY